MKTCGHITSWRRPAPGRHPMACLPGPSDMAGGGLNPCARLEPDAPNGCWRPCEPCQTALSRRGVSGCRGRTRTCDLVVMSHASCRCSTLLEGSGEAHHSAASFRRSTHDARKAAAEISPFVPLSTSRARSMLGLREPARTRVRVLGDLPMRIAKAETFSPLVSRYEDNVVMYPYLPNRQIPVNDIFAYLALVRICLFGKMPS